VDKPKTEAKKWKTMSHERITGDYSNENGRIRCRFDMFVRWDGYANRRKQTFCYRGDFFGNFDPDKMLCSLLKFLIKQHGKWYVAELYDNTRPKDDPERIVVRWNRGVIEENRLKNYRPMLANISLPEWLRE
jgi:hypothetical protein